jgi:hypothetical protein
MTFLHEPSLHPSSVRKALLERIVFVRWCLCPAVRAPPSRLCRACAPFRAVPALKIAISQAIFHSKDLSFGMCVQVSLSVRDRLASVPNGNYVVVTGINPTPLGEVSGRGDGVIHFPGRGEGSWRSEEGEGKSEGSLTVGVVVVCGRASRPRRSGCARRSAPTSTRRPSSASDSLPRYAIPRRRTSISLPGGGEHLLTLFSPGLTLPPYSALTSWLMWSRNHAVSGLGDVLITVLCDGRARPSASRAGPPAVATPR